jgi:nucleotide-binding universal stress UspA family protein
MEKILLYVDGSEEAIVAAQQAVCLAKHLGCELHAIYVVNVELLNDLLSARIFVPAEELAYEHDLEEDGRRYLKYVERIAESKGVNANTILARGTIRQEVIHVAKELAVDLIVIGEYEEAKSRLDTFYNEEERIVHEAPCSVLIVKDEERVTRMFEELG